MDANVLEERVDDMGTLRLGQHYHDEAKLQV